MYRPQNIYYPTQNNNYPTQNINYLRRNTSSNQMTIIYGLLLVTLNLIFLYKFI